MAIHPVHQRLAELNKKEFLHPHDPKQMRRTIYDVNEQLNCLFDDINNGIFGEHAKSGKFYQYLKSIKDQLPKS